MTDNVYDGIALKYADLSGQGTQLLYNNQISGTSYSSGTAYGHGIFLQRSSPHFYQNTIHDNQSAGIYCYSQSNVELRHQDEAFNEIYDNVDYGVWVNYSDNVYMGSYQDWLVFGTYNSTWGSASAVRVRADHNSTVMAEKNWWGSDFVDDDWFQQLNGSTVDYVPWLLEEELEGGMTAASAGLPAYLSGQTRAEKTSAAAWYSWHDDPEQALSLCDEVLATGEDDRLSQRAVSIAWSVLKDDEPNRFVDWAENLAGWPEASFTGVARLLEAAVFVAQEQPNQALKTLDWVKTTFPGTDLHKQALVDQTYIYALDLQNQPQAHQTLTEFKNLFPNDPLLAIAEDALRWSEDTGLNKPILPSRRASDQTVPGSYGLAQNYPNPFNPTTTVSYTLKEPGHVTLRVYDSHGREVATLVDRFQAAGTHEAAFTASSLPSGVYFCRLSVNGFTAVRKLLLLK